MIEEGLNHRTAAYIVGVVGVGLVDLRDVVPGYLPPVRIWRCLKSMWRGVPYRDSIFPAINGNGEWDVPRKDVVYDGCWTVKQERIIEGPDIGADADPKVEELLTRDMVIGHNHVGIAACVLPVHHVNCPEGALCGGRRDCVLGDSASGGPEDDNPAISAPDDLWSGMHQP